MDRRDFFGIIGAPLLRKLTPPVPMAKHPVRLTVTRQSLETAILQLPYGNPQVWRDEMATLTDGGKISLDLKFDAGNPRS